MLEQSMKYYFENNKFKIEGSSNELLEFIDSIKDLSLQCSGSFIKINNLYITIGEPPSKFANRLIFTKDELLIMSCKFREVVYGYEESELFFSETGYTNMLNRTDIGIKLIGEILDDKITK